MPLPVASPGRLMRSSLPPPTKRPASSKDQSESSPPTTRPATSSSTSRGAAASAMPTSPPSRPGTAAAARASSDLSTSRSPAYSRSSSATPSEHPDAAAAAARSAMPPPRLPALRRTDSARSNISTVSSVSNMAGGKRPEKKNVLDRAGSVIRRAAGVRSLKEEDEKTKVAAAPKTADRPEKEKPKDKERGLLRGLRSASRTFEKDKKEEKEKKPSGLKRSAAPDGRPSTSSSMTKTSPFSSLRSSRPTSMYVTSTSSSAATSTTSTSAKRSAAAPPPSTSSLGSRHRRNISSPADASAPSSKAERPYTSSSQTKLKRPPFTTLKQDFNGQPQVEKSRHAAQPKGVPPPPLDPATVHSQTQLLQYTCLYGRSHSTYADLTASARAKLRTRFTGISKQHKQAAERLAKKQRTHDARGLSAVVQAPAAGVSGRRRETMRSADEKIQDFSEAIRRLETLQQNEHQTLTRAFENWITGYAPPSATFGVENQHNWIQRRGRWIDGLGEVWRKECMHTGRRIEGCVNAIQAIVAAVLTGRDGENASMVAMVAEKWLEVARGLLEELQSMYSVEESVVNRERQALDEVVRSAGVGMDFVMEVDEEEGISGVWAR